eukprot:TRINITY_DN1895_c0_g1_i1.p1 TRINITY_DN1895_c0_g1~~TRINITY_DN1895_c0_g1_i1.p1  ORF type:complete len:265 (-),score=48.42 TRINITY_DN1895_c0_g1_i1:41-835(-)
MSISLPSFKEILLEVIHDGVLLVTFNRERRKNAFSRTMLVDFIATLKFASGCDEIRVVVLTGKGDYFSSGNDLGNFQQLDDMEKAMLTAKEDLRVFVQSLFSFPKQLIVSLNGPAIGMAATMLGHVDFIFASESSYIYTPFIDLGQTPEVASSFVFVQRLGFPKAQDLLILGRKFYAKELEGILFNSVFKDGKAALEHSINVAKKLADSAPFALQASKKLIRGPMIDMISKVNDIEVEELSKCWMRPECMEAIMKFLSRKQASL